MKVKDMEISKLKPYANNPRKNEAAVTPVAESIKAFGFKVPVVIDKAGVIVAGHTRLEAAKRLGMDKVPCVVADDLTEEQVKAFRLADNKVSEFSVWDAEKLAEELADISTFDMKEFGFDAEPNADDYGDDFSLPSGERDTPQTMTVILALKQKELILRAFQNVENEITETYGNKNKMGNCLYEVVRQWAEQKKLN